ncbi:GNAT family N-acetyltransferase [Desulfitobacterium sp.]|uniref:GNAT family N-acetyltransferase n=1 Tax=Desulfitobacterium sp. TaxID=49981 RepID=UPI003A520CBA
MNLDSVPLRNTNRQLFIYTEQFSDSEHFTVIDNGKPVSSMNLERVTDRHFIISKFSTLPDWQNQGIGTQFLEIVLNRFSDKTVQLFVDAENTKAISFYKWFGFTTVGELFNFERT